MSDTTEGAAGEAAREMCKGVVCRACDRKALYRKGGEVICATCGLVYSDHEYRLWLALLAADTKQRLREGDLEMPDSPEMRRLVA
jgi:uncharacterized Zn finger protein (UPF0148 family)